MKITEKIKKFKWGYVFISFITAVISICLFAFNNDSLNALAISIGVIIIAGGILLAALSLASEVRGFSFGVKITFSVAMLIAGIVVIIARDTTINVMLGIFGLVMIIDGSFKFQTAAAAKSFKLWCFIVMLVISVILIAGGYLTVRQLTIENGATVYILGALFMIDSIANFLSLFYISACEKHNENQIRNKIYKELDVNEKDVKNLEENSD